MTLWPTGEYAIYTSTIYNESLVFQWCSLQSQWLLSFPFNGKMAHDSGVKTYITLRILTPPMETPNRWFWHRMTSPKFWGKEIFPRMKTSPSMSKWMGCTCQGKVLILLMLQTRSLQSRSSPGYPIYPIITYKLLDHQPFRESHITCQLHLTKRIFQWWTHAFVSPLPHSQKIGPRFNLSHDNLQHDYVSQQWYRHGSGPA